MSGNTQEEPMGVGFDIDNLFQSAMEANWKEVLKVCKNNAPACMAKLTKSEDTALHIVIASFRANQVDADGHARMVEELVESLPQEQAVEILKARNVKEDTPLHLAASLGSVAICERIVSKGDKQLISGRNQKGETPLFLAARHGKMEACLRLHELYRDGAKEPDDRVYRRNDGDTILHSAISGEHFELAYQIISCNSKLVGTINQEGFSPLHILASKPNVFESSSNLRLVEWMIYRCVLVNKPKQNFKDGSRNVSSCCISDMKYPDNYQTCVNFIDLSRDVFRTITAFPKYSGLSKKPGSTADAENPKEKKEEQQGKRPKDENLFPENYSTCIRWFKFAMTLILIVLGIGIRRINDIRKQKQKHKWAAVIMDELIKKEANYKYSHNGDRPVDNVDMYRERIKPPPAPPEPDTYSSSDDDTTGSKSKEGSKLDAQTKDVKETPVVAAKMDIQETAKNILEKVTIQGLDVNGKNALLLAVDLAKIQDATTKGVKETPILLAARMGITEVVKKILEIFPVAIQDLDANDKNALLLAVENRQIKVFDMLMEKRLPEFVLCQVDNEGNSALHLAAKFQEFQHWRIPGAALQLQWEIKWYERVQESIPPQCFVQYNKKAETAREILMKTHEKLVKEGSEWMIKTSESCSVVAALIATVAFATSSAIPGGVDQTTGHPVLRKEPVFNVFSVASIVALCFSVTALVFFLAILTSRCQQKDFKNSLPWRLLFGLTSLFTSISAILVSFCAGHFFTLEDQMRNAAFPIYAVTCLPITIFAFVQLPLYIDLLWSTSRVPVRSYEVYYH